MSESPEDDLLSSVLNAYQLHAGVYGHPQFCGIWQYGSSGNKRAAFHLVGRGQCWLHMRGTRDAVTLEGGDLVVFPHDAWHMLTGSPELHGDENLMVMDGDGPFTTLICGYFEFAAGDKNPVLDALPEVIVVRREDAGRHLEIIGQLLLEEASTEGVGTRTVLDKLADTLFVMVVREYIKHCGDQRGVLAALADLRLRKALGAMHRDSAAAWTLETLAQTAGMSRASFTQRFSDVVGTTPIEYLTRWRMTQAELLLRDPHISVATAAERVGYETEAAFRKAFKRVHGVGPGSFRRWFRERIGGSA
ncbi:AraC family transcriptional regulator [Sinimarinibacterium sp. CAU 1509]|uniref:AraC family transcriptional regulator n=1 Tax=Sinimarinibacterium sp. CAU 1509 TaxID=2562283 RepID=UPI0010ACDFCC|nr:AraC family transcriptional regulator [Sinimarinibacterium sp. CAU 1509]TJY55945.1 AraC family transcriptional regulator [Sinimarinibacterium sp. CAU 1509]